MTNGNKILQAVYLAIDRINEQLPPDRKLAKARTTMLSESSGGLDSLELVYFVVAVEDALSSECGLTVSLADAMAQDDPGAVFESVESLMVYLEAFCEKTE